MSAMKEELLNFFKLSSVGLDLNEHHLNMYHEIKCNAMFIYLKMHLQQICVQKCLLVLIFSMLAFGNVNRVT